MIRAAGTLILGLALVGPAEAQSLAQRIARAPDGTVRMTFTAREGVCGNGRNINFHNRSDRHWEWNCEPGPVRVALEVRDGRVTDVRTYVGGRWRRLDNEVTDLGEVSAPEAAEFFLDLSESGRRVGGDPLTPAVLADSVITWPRLLAIGKNASLTRDIRRKAVFWVSQEAGEAATRGLAELAEDEKEDQEVREQAVFALSQLDHDRGVPHLIRIARNDRDPSVRKKAIFWLGQSDDPRALELFEELLTRKPD